MLMTYELISTKIHDFLRYTNDVKQLSLNTQRAYKADLHQFTIFWQHLHSYSSEEISFIRALEQFIATLYHKQLNKQSIARKISCFSSFCTFLSQQGITVTLSLQRPIIIEKAPTVLSAHDLCSLLDTLDETLPTRYPYRDKAILEVLYATGIRCSELVSITLCDIDFSARTIHIKGKGKKNRIVFFGIPALTRLRSYFEYERPPFKDQSERVFLNYCATPLTPRSVQRICVMFRQFLTLSQQQAQSLTPHKIRHSFAAHLLREGTDIALVQDLLGHETRISTEKYLACCRTNTNKPSKKLSQ